MSRRWTGFANVTVNGRCAHPARTVETATATRAAPRRNVDGLRVAPSEAPRAEPEDAANRIGAGTRRDWTGELASRPASARSGSCGPHHVATWTASVSHRARPPGPSRKTRRTGSEPERAETGPASLRAGQHRHVPDPAGRTTSQRGRPACRSETGPPGPGHKTRQRESSRSTPATDARLRAVSSGSAPACTGRQRPRRCIRLGPCAVR